MKKLKLKKLALPLAYLTAVLFIVTGSVLIEGDTNDPKKEEVPKLTYVSSIVVSSDYPVISVDIRIKRPYNDSDITIGKYFYNKDSQEDEQLKSITYYDGVYTPNKGVDYEKKDKFSVTTILSGTIVKITRDDILGNVVEIKHGNNLVSVYQGLSEVNVNENDIVTQGQMIGTSGTNKLNENNHLHFELYYLDEAVNPEEYYEKALNEL